METTKKLKAICNKYCNIEANDNNYSIGGGLDDGSFASRRHEDACNDEGKLTVGKATQMFKKATGADIDVVREILNYAVPNMEWHHAGKLPKSYGGGMKKTYFLNAVEICDVAKNWDNYLEKLNLSKIAAKNAEELKKELETRKLEFLQANAKRYSRMSKRPEFDFLTDREMNGKYGWFDSTSKSYNLPEYFSGWEFVTQELYSEFLKII